VAERYDGRGSASTGFGVRLNRVALLLSDFFGMSDSGDRFRSVKKCRLIPDTDMTPNYSKFVNGPEWHCVKRNINWSHHRRHDPKHLYIERL